MSEYVRLAAETRNGTKKKREVKEKEKDSTEGYIMMVYNYY